MDVAFAILGCFGREAIPRQRRDELSGELDRVHELALRGSRVHRDAANRHPDRLGRERLDLELSEPRSVERVRDVCAELLEIEVLGAKAHLFVNGERDAKRRPRQLRMAGEVGDCSHDLGDAGLVVRAEQRRSVARHEVVSHTLRELRQLVRVEHLARVAGKRDRQPFPGLVHDRSDAVGGDVGSRVDVCDEPHDGRVGRAGQGREHGRARRQLGVGETDLGALPPAGGRVRAASRCSGGAMHDRRPACRS